MIALFRIVNDPIAGRYRLPLWVKVGGSNRRYSHRSARFLIGASRDGYQIAAVANR